MSNRNAGTKSEECHEFYANTVAFLQQKFWRYFSLLTSWWIGLDLSDEYILI